jgi:hypothetical protein
VSFFEKFEERRLILISGFIVFVLSMLTGIYFNQVLSLILTALLIYIGSLTVFVELIELCIGINHKYFITKSVRL